jgi:hypothetical protein
VVTGGAIGGAVSGGISGHSAHSFGPQGWNLNGQLQVGSNDSTGTSYTLTTGNWKEGDGKAKVQTDQTQHGVIAVSTAGGPFIPTNTTNIASNPQTNCIQLTGATAAIVGQVHALTAANGDTFDQSVLSNVQLPAGASITDVTPTPAASPGVVFRTLEIARPDLETVFLTLTGRSLRDQ